MTVVGVKGGSGPDGSPPAESGADILAAARALGPLIRAEAAAIEAAGRLTDKVVAGTAIYLQKMLGYLAVCFNDTKIEAVMKAKRHY